ncbi:MAG: 6-phospho-beta-glucosidase [bacterium]|nr:6-phospho-beta-glucosidase [bacterium]
MKQLILTVIGGGSTYTPELVEGIIKGFEVFPVKELRLVDIDEEKLNIVGSLVRRMVESSNVPIKLSLTTDRKKALEGADFVVSQIRVGGIRARIKDERIPLEFGVIGQETTGAGGFANALRTIPVMLDIAKDIEELTNNAWLINFTNPSGIVTEALLRFSKVKTIGLCNVPINFFYRFANILGVDISDIYLDYVGLNHLSWVRRVYCRGNDVTNKILENVKDGLSQKERGIVELINMIPNSYLHYYYFKDEVLEAQKSSERTRGEIVLEVEEKLLEKYKDESLKEKPPELSQRGGAHYSDAAVELMKSIYLDRRDIQIVNVMNNGSITDLPDNGVVEVPCVISGNGAMPISMGRLEPFIKGLAQTVKYYEQLTVESAVEGDIKKAKQALLIHPLVGAKAVAEGLLEKILEENKTFLPQFFGR